MKSLADRLRERQEQARIERLKVFQRYEDAWVLRLEEMLLKTCRDFDTEMTISYSNIIYGRKDLDISNNDFVNDRDLVQRDFFSYLVPILSNKFGMRVTSGCVTITFKWGKDQYKR